MITIDFSAPDKIIETDKVYVAHDSVHTLEFSLRRDSSNIDLSSYQVKIRFETSAGFVGDEPCTITNSAQGQCKYKMLGAQLVEGVVIGIISLYLNEERESSCKFSFSCCRRFDER